MDFKFYAEYAEKLYENGFVSFPIKPGTKVPDMDGGSWQSDIGIDEITQYTLNGKGYSSIGIKDCHAIDVDILDADISAKVLELIKSEKGADIAVRVGKAPKFLIPVHPDSEITKKLSSNWYDKEGQKHAIEILCAGQQYYVGFGVHESTKKPYTWHGRSILDTTINDLPVFDEYDIFMLIDLVDELCESAGMTRNKPSKKDGNKKNAGKKTENDTFRDLKIPAGKSIKELKKYISGLPIELCDDRDEWIRIGAALHFETQGSNDGYELFDKWSQQSDKYAGTKDTMGRWESFRADKTGRDCATLGTIIAALPAGVREELTGVNERYMSAIDTAQSSIELKKIIDAIKVDPTVDDLTKDSLALIIKNRGGKLGLGWTVRTIKKEMSSKKTVKKTRTAGATDVPQWLDGFVYLMNQDKFGRISDIVTFSRSSMCGAYDKYLIDAAETTGDENMDMPTDRYALNIARIPTVYDHLYWPGQGEFFTYEGHKYSNMYCPDSRGGRKPRGDWTAEDCAAVQMYEDHITEMFQEDGEAVVVLDTLCHIAQRGETDRIQWMLIIYGCEGDGKTMLLQPLVRCKGARNARVINSEEITKHSFTDWAHGNTLKIIEELKQPNYNRYEVVNNIKPFITNENISIHPKGRKPFMAPNTATYIATTNHFDCLPFSDAHRRFAFAKSQWSSKREILSTKGADYFKRLYKALDEHDEAINEYLCTRAVSDSFDHYTAPDTPSMKEAISLNESEEMAIVREIIADESVPDVNEHAINLTSLDLKLEFDYNLKLNGYALSNPLRRLGYNRYVNRLRINNKLSTIWIKNVKLPKDKKESHTKVRSLLSCLF